MFPLAWYLFSKYEGPLLAFSRFSKVLPTFRLNICELYCDGHTQEKQEALTVLQPLFTYEKLCKMKNIKKKIIPISLFTQKAYLLSIKLVCLFLFSTLHFCSIVLL